jgi:hypothetical protein
MKAATPRPTAGNVLAWRAWGLCFPDCRIVGLSGLGFWDWTQVKTVLEAWGLTLSSSLHRKLRLGLQHAMKFEKEERDKERDNGK